MEDGNIITINEISDDFNEWKYVVRYYEDVTVIEYWELIDGAMTQKDSFHISAGFDLKLFESAAKFLRDWKDR